MFILMMLVSIYFETTQVNIALKSQVKKETEITKYLNKIVLPDQRMRDLEEKVKMLNAHLEWTKKTVEIIQSRFVFGWFIPGPVWFPPEPPQPNFQPAKIMDKD
jgi:hypothetical protein